ncbi:hypothetical protein fugu_012265 [Takifugu bimaculatus]|uniref:Shelterin complex subunit TPP1/Est3 domain-containing protein n=1 Tax=Takifugu bimaculatus TaxID=433685 RepID=A0A4Z2CA14_9TELE|nr:hypothetical protein fugu_012265 [Takifugu bimaculatus]
MPARRKLRPWIEELILGYGTERGRPGRGSGPLWARVARVEQMSQSQAQSSDCPPGRLLLSDGVVLIPAVLTTAAWERLQEQEDRDSFEGLVNSMVVIMDYQLQFHTAPEQNRSRFFLSVGELAMTSVGPPGNKVPCCTALASVQLKICQTWKDLLDENLQDSESSQSGVDLSILLGEWQRDCFQDVLRDVEDRLARPPCGPPSPQPSTSSAGPGPPKATGWDVDRVRFKTEEPFSVPVKWLLIPDVLQRQAAENGPGPGPAAGATRQGGVLLRPPVQQREPDRRAAVEPGPDAGDKLLPPAEDAPGDHSVGPLSNPWDIFTPPGESPCSSGASRGETPTGVCPSPPAAPPPATPLQSEHSGLPPYQDPPPLDPHATAVGVSTGASPGPPTEQQPSTGQLPVPEETGDRKLRRKRRRPAGEGGAGTSSSPPSWLFDTQTHGGAREEHRHHSVLRKTPSVHSDGRSFSYSYRASGQNQQDLSRFKVRAAWLQWALRYLLRPEKNPGPVFDQGSSGQTGCTT